ncbi:MAG: Undecaprenyl-phosphate galactose phosphotransferase, partial [Verrucomicrobiales bacterium]|nr:Undecaprenyl-phosphate galactose phosphotransferase [Verrucomicrobiales bacterium]
MKCFHTSSTQPVEQEGNFVKIPSWKRGVDFTCIVLAAPIVLPVGLLIALIVKIASRGPVLFYQERVGYLGKNFHCMKFRTMHVNAETQVHAAHLADLISSNQPMTKLDTHDNRVIPFGRILRATGLDELPQLINVLKGEMSLVGPRPCLPYEYERYLPRHRGRCATLPGLTGLWQVNGKNRTTFEEMIDLDLDYCQKKSVWLDLKIMAMTIPAIFVQVWDTLKRKAAAR